jgi:hypothetical protein
MLICLQTDVFVTRISKKQAAKLRSPTLRIPTDPDNFVMGLDVFHQLHCLVSADEILEYTKLLTAHKQNGVRKLLHRDYYQAHNESAPLLEPNHAGMKSIIPAELTFR